MKNIKHILTVIILIPFFASCSDDYLNTEPTSATGTSVVFETTDNAALAINGICKLMTMQYLGNQGMNGEGTIKMWYGNYPGNNFYVNLPGWSSIINSTYHESTSSMYNYYPWYYYYRILGNANAIVAYIDAASGPATDKQFIKAQALTFRAYAYMMLAQLYSYRWSDSNNGATDGLVLRLDLSNGDLPLSTLLETYNQIYKDLDDAISMYKSSGKSRKSGDFFSPNINVAYATYARAALNRQDYTKASSNAKLAREGYPLMSVADYKAGFCNPNQEWIWGTFSSVDETLYFYSYHAYIGYNSTASNVRTYPKCISKEIFEKIPVTDMRKALFLDPTGYTYTTASGLASAQLKAKAFQLYPALDAAASVYAYMQFKIKANDMPGVGNLNHFRSSEMYLIEAEAEYFLNNASKAQSVLVELTKGSGRDAQYACTKTGADLLNEIKLYRAIELWGEGFDWFDFKRWGDTLDRKTYEKGGNFLAALAVTIKPDETNKWTWKIPLKETDFNKMVMPK